MILFLAGMLTGTIMASICAAALLSTAVHELDSLPWEDED